MSLDRLTAPDKDGETLILPPLDEYGEALDGNRRIVMESSINGEPIQKLIAEARDATLEKAYEYTAGLGLNPGPSPDPEAPIIASGHQPSMFHPGVALKSMALAKVAKKIGAVSLYISVDSDEFRSQTVPVPVMGETLKRKEYTLFPQDGATIYETARVESGEKTIQRLVDIQEELKLKRLGVATETLAWFTGVLEKRLTQNESYTGRSIIMRRMWEEPVADGFLELPVSLMCRARPFLVFALDILARLEEFSPIYNDELNRYRKERKLRYPANPFPNLETGEGYIETPFWIISDGARERLYITSGNEKLLYSETMERRPLADLEHGEIDIRPRAIVLTMYLRLLVCDLFIHGVGGAKYDKITDQVMRRFYNVTPPRYTCVSGAVWVGASCDNPEEEIERIRKALRDIEQHPETLAEQDGAGHIALQAIEKKKLVEEIRKPDADKKMIGNKIKQLNKEMTKALAPMKKRLENDLQKLNRAKAEWDVATARDYPFFLYKPETVRALLD